MLQRHRAPFILILLQQSQKQKKRHNKEGWESLLGYSQPAPLRFSPAEVLGREKGLPTGMEARAGSTTSVGMIIFLIEAAKRGIIKAGKGLQDCRVQPLTQHCQKNCCLFSNQNKVGHTGSLWGKDNSLLHKNQAWEMLVHH